MVVIGVFILFLNICPFSSFLISCFVGFLEYQYYICHEFYQLEKEHFGSFALNLFGLYISCEHLSASLKKNSKTLPATNDKHCFIRTHKYYTPLFFPGRFAMEFFHSTTNKKERNPACGDDELN